MLDVGVPALTRKLSEKYMSMMRDTVPSIREEIRRRLVDADAELNVLGSDYVSSDARQRFVREVQKRFLATLDLLRGFQSAGTLIPRDDSSFSHRARIEELFSKFGCVSNDLLLDIGFELSVFCVWQQQHYLEKQGRRFAVDGNR